MQAQGIHPMDRTKFGHLVSFRVSPAILLIICFLIWPARSSAQKEIIVYDGYTGIQLISLLGDTARVVGLLPESPAVKAGIRLRDQIISINDSVIAGQGLSLREIKSLLYNRAGYDIRLQVRRKGEDSLLTFFFRRDPYLYHMMAYEFEYLIDSLEQWDIADMIHGSLDSLFRDPLPAKGTVYSVEKGSRADQLGIRPGDRVVSMMDLYDRDPNFHVSSGVLAAMASDTVFTIQRDDSLIHFHGNPVANADLEGAESQFGKDFSYGCAWLKITIVNRISENRDYLFYLPEMSGTDSVNVYSLTPSGSIEQRRSGILIPVDQRDFVYKDWHVVSLPLIRDSVQTFYLRWKSHSSIGAPQMQVIAKETLVKHDRIERMILFALLGMMVIISIFFLILFFAIQGRQYIYFAFYILCTAAFLFVSEGYLGEFHWTEKVIRSGLFESAQAYVLSLLTACFLLFGAAYLELRKTLPGWYWAVISLLGLIGIRVLTLMLGSVFQFQIGGWFEDITLIVWALAVGFIPLFLLVLPAIFRIQQGFKPAWYFLMANVVLIPLALITISSSTLTYTAYHVHQSILVRIMQVSGVYMAAVIQILIFSIGIAKKMRLDEQEHKRAQQKIIDQLKENEKLKDKVNRELEQKVLERTREIREQKEEIEAQRDEIEAQRDEIEAQRDMVFAQNKEITDSIGYAQRIQAAILPHTSYLDAVIPEYFVLFKPRDIVSGDFYWVREVEGSVVVVVADCTGHGVPGAFMSMLGITLLSEQLGKGRIEKPGEILGQLRTKVKQMLVQEGSIKEQKDGMDMAIAVIDKEKKMLQFAGAYNPLYLVSNRAMLEDSTIGTGEVVDGEGARLFELKGDRQPIGIHWEEKKFTTQKVALKQGDTVYVFSDGYMDQFGGDQRKKFKHQRFKELILSLQSESMKRQKQILEETFERWRGNIEQIDDVCVIGIRI